MNTYSSSPDGFASGQGSRNHLVELAFYFGRELGLNLIDIGELGEAPSAVRPEVGNGGQYANLDSS